MCRTDKEPDGPKTCPADTRSHFATATRLHTQLHTADAELSTALSTFDEGHAASEIVPAVHSPTTDRRWRIIDTDDTGTPTGRPDRYATDNEVNSLDTSAEDACDWDTDDSTATGWTGCGFVIIGQFLTAVHIDHHPDYDPGIAALD